MTIYKTIIADDEPAALESITALLSNQPDINIVATCHDGQSAAEAIIEHQPDLVLLDIQMPELTGIEVLEAVQPSKAAYIFVTAFDQYAIKAFEQSALDYLLKPYSDERFYIALNKARTALQSQETNAQLVRIEQLLTQRETFKTKLVSKTGGKITFVPVDAIMSIESDGNFVKLHTATGKKIADYTLKQLEVQLDPSVFVRVHKSFMINVNSIESMEPHFHGDYQLTLKDGSLVKLSRSYKEAFDQIVGI